MIKIRDLRRELEDACRTNDRLAKVATLEQKVGEGQRALAREQENVARLEQGAEDLSNHNNALEVQLTNQTQPTAVGTG
ncbi:hypothetical protein DL765_001544 [Monosporascus sp. GIB2]|nr:hypothetical protein DL765_001544 [Monosporascus sp. GIB2]